MSVSRPIAHLAIIAVYVILVGTLLMLGFRPHEQHPQPEPMHFHAQHIGQSAAPTMARLEAHLWRTQANWHPFKSKRYT